MSVCNGACFHGQDQHHVDGIWLKCWACEHDDLEAVCLCLEPEVPDVA